VRSKPDPVDQPEITTHYDCAICIAEMIHNTETVLLIFPFLKTNITVHMRPSGGQGGRSVWRESRRGKVPKPVLQQTIKEDSVV